MKERVIQLKYAVFDWLTAFIIWCLLPALQEYNIIHFSFFEHNFKPHFFTLQNQLLTLIIPFGYVVCFFILGYYNNVFRKSRLDVLKQTAITIFFGTLLLHFTAVSYCLKDGFLWVFCIILFCHTGLACLVRILLTSQTIGYIRTGNITFPTILIANIDTANDVYKKVVRERRQSGNKFLGYILINPEIPEPQTSEEETFSVKRKMQNLGSLKDLNKIIKETKAKEIILSLPKEQDENILSFILSEINDTNVLLKIAPTKNDVLMGRAVSTTFYQQPFILIHPELLSPAHAFFKRTFDIVFSIIAIIILSPVYAFTAIGVKMSSKGPIFFRQERIGKNGVPFNIVKFRSMYVDAEVSGPQLSRKGDARITPFGRFMRKSRLDEIPQFFNVLKGEMSIVGPRPERQFYIDQILRYAPQYKLLSKAKPGITSWGQVKYGYAENVQEMLERMTYDLIYIENISLMMDIKILFYTVWVVIEHKGK